MKRAVWIWQFFGFAVTSLCGTLLHFLYDWLGEAGWIAPFSGVNESTWEHMKLLFWPSFIFAVIEGLFFKSYERFWCVKLRGIVIGLCLIPILFYTYNGVIGKSPDFINISIFFISAASAYIYEAWALKNKRIACRSQKGAVLMLCIIALSFVLFTFKTPEINLFRDPITNTYGI